MAQRKSILAVQLVATRNGDMPTTSDDALDEPSLAGNGDFF